jgi:hypothetical protein
MMARAEPANLDLRHNARMKFEKADQAGCEAGSGTSKKTWVTVQSCRTGAVSAR